MKLRFVLWLIILGRGFSTAISIGTLSSKCLEAVPRPRLMIYVPPRGFAVVFAEDVSDVQSTDVVSGESIIFPMYGRSC